jgi:hypothetical protein
MAIGPSIGKYRNLSLPDRFISQWAANAARNLHEDDMATNTTANKPASKSNGGRVQTGKSASKSNANQRRNTAPASDGRHNNPGRPRQRAPEVPAWLATVMSVVGVGVAVGAGLYASRRQWLPKAQEWRDEFSAAYADDETDYENFDQTRHAGKDSMRDHPGDDWEDIDDMSDASFPASDPPSFNPGTAG